MKIIRRIPFWIVLMITVVIFILPFLFMVSNSFEEFSYVLPVPPRILPGRINFSAYEHVLTQSVLPQAALPPQPQHRFLPPEPHPSAFSPLQLPQYLLLSLQPHVILWRICVFALSTGKKKARMMSGQVLLL